MTFFDWQIIDCLIVYDCPVDKLVKWWVSVLLSSLQYTQGLHGWFPSASVLSFVFMVNGLDSATVDGASIALIFFELLFSET